MSMLCKLGFHKWKYDCEDYDKSVERVCVRCPKIQRHRLNCDGMGINDYWEDIK